MVPEEGDDDVFISPVSMGGAFNGDRVLASFSHKAPQDKRKEGIILKVLARGKKSLVGTFEEIPNGGFVVPEDKSWGSDVFVPRDSKNGAKANDKVIVRITKWEKAEGRNPIN